MSKSPLTLDLVAPCGINCGVCRGHLRTNDPCPGCRHIGSAQPKSRLQCQLRLCRKRQGKFCCDCAEFPCDKLKKLDARYRKKYGMSEIENLEYIRDNGIRKFVARECARWLSDQGVLCVHDRKRYKRS
jgi:hypothetical protein